eukprot:m.95938 g.95938  ORF g.95938 m.95938 type:complete len:293 (+) comp36883_c0_seq6:2827-3705(+)
MSRTDGSVTRRFQAAVRAIQSLPQQGSYQPSNEAKLKFYAFYKTATEGSCKASQPSFWEVVKKAKWEAWRKLDGMSKIDAMQNYAEEVIKIAEDMPHNEEVEAFLLVMKELSESEEEKDGSKTEKSDGKPEIEVLKNATSETDLQSEEYISADDEVVHQGKSFSPSSSSDESDNGEKRPSVLKRLLKGKAKNEVALERQNPSESVLNALAQMQQTVGQISQRMDDLVLSIASIKEQLNIMDGSRQKASNGAKSAHFWIFGIGKLLKVFASTASPFLVILLSFVILRRFWFSK